jgi:hypothetical protein
VRRFGPSILGIADASPWLTALALPGPAPRRAGLVGNIGDGGDRDGRGRDPRGRAAAMKRVKVEDLRGEVAVVLWGRAAARHCKASTGAEAAAARRRLRF